MLNIIVLNWQLYMYLVFCDLSSINLIFLTNRFFTRGKRSNYIGACYGVDKKIAADQNHFRIEKKSLMYDRQLIIPEIVNNWKMDILFIDYFFIRYQFVRR